MSKLTNVSIKTEQSGRINSQPLFLDLTLDGQKPFVSKVQWAEEDGVLSRKKPAVVTQFDPSFWFFWTSL